MKTVALSLMILVAALVAGCDRGTSQSNSATSATTQATTLSELRLGFFPNLTHGQAVLGVASGDFANAVAPAKFTPLQFNAGPALIEALFNKQIDIGYVGPGPATGAFARSHGEGIRVIGGAAANGVIIVARKGAGITSLTDLAGKKIATPQHANTQDIAARHYLLTTLKQSNTENVLPIPNPDQAGAMARGDIDAAWVPEPWGSVLIASTGGQLVGEEKDLWPNQLFSLTVIVTTPEFLSAHPDAVAQVLGVNHTWTQRLSSDPMRYVSQLDDALAKFTGKRLPPGVTAQAIARVKFTEDPLPQTLSANAQWAFDLGFTRDNPKLDGLTDLTILQKIQAASTTQPSASP